MREERGTRARAISRQTVLSNEDQESPEEQLWHGEN